MLRRLYIEGRERLERAGVEDADYDARALLLHAFDIDAAGYLMLLDTELSVAFPDEKERNRAQKDYFDSIERRTERIPLQQIIGETVFCGLPFFVTEDVLCPRQDTELIVERVISDWENVDRSGIKLLDLCTGSGCIGISMAKLGGFSHVTAVDISEKALFIAEKNAGRILGDGWKNKIRLQKSNLFAELSGECYDIIVSNPPYIESAVIEKLEPEVRLHEPVIALDGDVDGLAFYRRITSSAGDYLNAGGQLYVEIGYNQGESVCELFRKGGFEDVRLYHDYAGNARLVYGKWNGYNKKYFTGRG